MKILRKIYKLFRTKAFIIAGLGLIFFSLVMSACSNDASHLPSPFELPGMVIGSSIENASYNAKRKRVSAYVSRNYLGIRQDVNSGGGKFLEGALDSANLKGNKRLKAKTNILKSYKQIFSNSGLVEDALINVFAALYVHTSSPGDKRINGFHYSEARQVIRNFADQNFEALRLDIKNGNGQTLNRLALKLRMQESQKRDEFIKKSRKLYHRIYLEPVIVAIMVYS